MNRLRRTRVVAVAVAVVLAVLSTAAAEEPKNADAYTGQGASKADRGNWKGAAEEYTKALESNPKFVRAYLLRALAKEKIGDWKGAVEDYSKVIELDPKYAQALADFQAAQKLDPQLKENLALVIAVCEAVLKK